MPLMRSSARARARSRLATSKTVNIMFSNGLGVCKLGNAGSRSICRRKTFVPRKPGAFATGYVKPFNDTTDTDKNLLNFKTNIKGATITLVGDIGGLENQTLIATTGNITVDNTNKYFPRAFESNGIAFTNGITVTNVKLTLTGGKINPNGGWNINNVSHTVKIPDFTIDIDAPTPFTPLMYTSNDGIKIIIGFSNGMSGLPENITSNGPLHKSDFALQVNGNEVDFSVKITGGQLEMVPGATIAAGATVDVGYLQPQAPVGAPGSLQDAAGNLVSTFGLLTVTNVVGVGPTPVTGAAGPPVTGSRVNYPNTNQILLEFTKPISSSLSGPLDKTDFIIGGVASGTTVTSVQITSGKVLLTLPGVIVQSDSAITVAYTGAPPGNTVLKSTDNLIAPDFPNLIVYNNIPDLAVKNATFDADTITIEYIRPVIAPTDLTDFLLNWEYSLRETINGGLKVGAPYFVPSGFTFVNDTIVLTRANDEDGVGGRWPAAFIALQYSAPTLSAQNFTDADGNLSVDAFPPVYVTGSVPRALSAVCDTTATPYIITLTYSGKIAENTNLLGKFTSSGITNNPTITDVTVTSDGKVELSFSGVIAVGDVPIIQYTDVGNANEMKTTSGVAFISNYCAGFGINYDSSQTLNNQGQPNVSGL